MYYKIICINEQYNLKNVVKRGVGSPIEGIENVLRSVRSNLSRKEAIVRGDKPNEFYVTNRVDHRDGTSSTFPTRYVGVEVETALFEARWTDKLGVLMPVAFAVFEARDEVDAAIKWNTFCELRGLPNTFEVNLFRMLGDYPSNYCDECEGEHFGELVELD